MLEPMAKHVRGRAIVAVCDISKYPDVGRRERALSGTTIIYRNGREVARSDGAPDAAFVGEMKQLGLIAGGT
jgi:hypothetical protein